MALNAIKKFFNSRLNAKGEPISLGGDIASIGQDGSVDVQNATVAAKAITYAKIQDTAAGFKVIGKKNTGAGSVEEIVLAADQVLAKSGSGNIAGQTVATAMITAKAVTYACIQDTAAGYKIIGKPTTAAGAVSEIAMGADSVLARSGSGDITAQKVVPAMTSSIPVGLNFGVPATNVANRYVVEATMRVGTYTLANSGLPGDSLCHNVSITHIAEDTVDTLGHIDIVGTDYNDAALTESITPVNGTTVYGAKAFKTVTSVTGVGWVIDVTEGTADHITVGFGGLIGLPVILSAAANLVMATHGTGVLNAPTVAIGAAIGQCTIDLTTVGDGAKRLRLFYQN